MRLLNSLLKSLNQYNRSIAQSVIPDETAAKRPPFLLKLRGCEPFMVQLLYVRQPNWIR